MGVAVVRPATSGGSLSSFDKIPCNNRPRSSLGFDNTKRHCSEIQDGQQGNSGHSDVENSKKLCRARLAISAKTAYRVSKDSHGLRAKPHKLSGIGQYTRAPPLNKGPKLYAQVLHCASRTRYWSKDRKIMQMFVWALTQTLSHIGKVIPSSPQKAWVYTILAQYRARLLGDPFNLRNTYRYTKTPILKPRIINATNIKLRSLDIQASQLIFDTKFDNVEILALLRGQSRGRGVVGGTIALSEAERSIHNEFMSLAKGAYARHIIETREVLNRLLQKSAQADQRLRVWKAELPSWWSRQ